MRADGHEADRQWPPPELCPLPMPRMTNTNMLRATASGGDRRSVKKGVDAVNFGGGQVDITSGKYVFQPTRPIRSKTARWARP